MALTGLTNLQPLHIKTVGIGTFDNTVSIGGTLTYEDVTNVDAIGIITARSGVNVSGGQLDVGSNIKLGNAGVITATSFVGSGSGLTGISGVSVANQADNRLITATGTTDALNGESALTFSGQTLSVYGVAGDPGRIDIKEGGAVSRIMTTRNSDTNGDLRFFTEVGGSLAVRAKINYSGDFEIPGYLNIGTGTAEQQLTVQNSAQHSLIRVISKNDSDAGIDFGDVDDTDRAGIRYTNSTDSLALIANADTRVVIDSSGRVMIGGGSSPSQVGDGRLMIYSTDRLHPAIKCAGTSNNYANGWTLLGDNYQADESQINLGVSYSSSSLVLSRGVKVSGSADNTYLSSQDSYATRPCAIRMDSLGAFNFLTTETNATVATDSAVSLTEVFKIDRVGNIYQRITNRYMYFGASNVMRIGTNGSDPMIDAVSGDLQIKDAGNNICTVRSDGFEMYQGIYPSADGGEDLGKSGRRWANIYTNDLNLSNENGKNDVDGTWGNYTIQEGESDLFLINNRNGKKYKFNLTEVS